MWDLSPGENGLATDPSEPIDIEQIEAEYMSQQFAEYQEEKQSQQKMVGKRLRTGAQPTPRRAPPKNFWIWTNSVLKGINNSRDFSNEILLRKEHRYCTDE